MSRLLFAQSLTDYCAFIRAVPAGYGFVVGWCFVMAFFSLMCGLVMQGFTSTVEGKLTAGAQDSRRMMTAGGAESSAVRHVPAQAAAVLQAGEGRACLGGFQSQPAARRPFLQEELAPVRFNIGGVSRSQPAARQAGTQQASRQQSCMHHVPLHP